MNTHKYFKNQAGDIFAYAADGSEDAFIKPGLTKLTAQEVEAITAPKPLSQAEKLKLYVAAIQAHMDAQAQALGYDDIKTAVTYADEPAVAKFQNEGQALRAWRSLVWAAAYELLDQVEAGDAEEPALEDLPDMLPTFVLP